MLSRSIGRVVSISIVVFFLFFLFVCFFFFFKQKTAYEIRNCDWSSDVCSSDLIDPAAERNIARGEAYGTQCIPATKLPKMRLLVAYTLHSNNG